ncbi:MAG: M14 family zinc carboxypeptidase [Ignavibacteria bacterium]|nr:M14 family zinc carboxypeptidase [Ignavibacteria bacterium]
MNHSVRLLLISLLLPFTLLADEQVRFFGSNGIPVIQPGDYDSTVPHPDDILGFPLGERPVRHAQVLEYFEQLEASTDRVRLFQSGSTYEGRPLLYAVISDMVNIGRLEEIREDLHRLADPRLSGSSAVNDLVRKTPAVVWLAYSIHGDEISGVDASLAVAYHLAAGNDSITTRLRRELIIIVDPIENPDGRERYLAQMESFAAAVPHADGQSLQKGGFWPWGRGNHYLFDMNRDWFTQELPESKARVAAITDWNPHVLVDAHEMGQWDSYLFSPPRHPFTPQLSDRMREWWNTFAADQAAAFDQYGWAYYSGEWNEEWYPGYGSSWPLFGGTIAILYEQAGVSGSRVSRHDGTVLAYAEAVQHHYVSSLANLKTTADHRPEILSEYHKYRKEALDTFGGGPAKRFLIRPDGNNDRLDHLGETLMRQGIEVLKSTESFTASARNYFSSRNESTSFPVGTMIIWTDQPLGFLIQAILSFDLQIPDSFLIEERRELLKHRSSRLYEITGWSLLEAYGLDAYQSESALSPATEVWQTSPAIGSVSGADPLQGFLFETHEDHALKAIAAMFEAGLNLSATHEELDWDGATYDRGSIFIPRRANDPDYEESIREIAEETGLTVHAISSGRGTLGPDIGGREVSVLRRPSVALVAGVSTQPDHVGWLWHLLDQKLGVPVSLLDIAQLGFTDLSIYNVLILPSGWGYSRVFGKQTIDSINEWITSGGTLIAMDNGAEFCADSTTGISSVRLREQVLEKLDEYMSSIDDQLASESPSLEGVHPWNPGKKNVDAPIDPPKKPGIAELKKQDELGRLFRPRGAILRVELDREEWMTFGLPPSLPVIMTSSNALLAKHPPVRTIARFQKPDRLRVAGLLWPEAAERIALSAYCTREQKGSGQIILFADQPNFRSFFRGSERILSNAILLGPGLGTSWTPSP